MRVEIVLPIGAKTIGATNTHEWTRIRKIAMRTPLFVLESANRIKPLRRILPVSPAAPGTLELALPGDSFKRAHDSFGGLV